MWNRNDLVSRSVLVTKALREIGVQQNDLISIVSDNRHEYVPIAFGILCLNAILAPVNYSYTERKIKCAIITQLVDKEIYFKVN